MLTPPEALPRSELARALDHWWGLAVTSAEYRPVGWGSHHWEVTGTGGQRCFVTADDLQRRGSCEQEPLAARFGRLCAALAAAQDLRDSGATFVVAPVRCRDGGPAALVGGRFGVAVYPFVEGQSFGWGEFSSAAHRRGVLDLVVAVHSFSLARWEPGKAEAIADSAPPAARRRALADDFSVPRRDALEAALDPAGDVPDCGPYAAKATLLVRQHAAAIGQLVARYDALVARARAGPARTVLTHGEPHPGNTMLTADGWVLIDWDTALVAPPERDLWCLDPGDGSIFSAYADATGVVPLPDLVELYRVRWDIADIAGDVSRFRQPHGGGPEDEKAFGILAGLVARTAAADR
jgi:hypothetical protein